MVKTQRVPTLDVEDLETQLPEASRTWMVKDPTQTIGPGKKNAIFLDDLEDYPIYIHKQTETLRALFKHFIDPSANPDNLYIVANNKPDPLVESGDKISTLGIGRPHEYGGPIAIITMTPEKLKKLLKVKVRLESNLKVLKSKKLVDDDNALVVAIATMAPEEQRLIEEVQHEATHVSHEIGDYPHYQGLSIKYAEEHEKFDKYLRKLRARILKNEKLKTELKIKPTVMQRTRSNFRPEDHIDFDSHLLGHPVLTEWFLGNRAELTKKQKTRIFLTKLRLKHRVKISDIDKSLYVIDGPLNQEQYKALVKVTRKKATTFRKDPNEKTYKDLNRWMAFSYLLSGLAPQLQGPGRTLSVDETLEKRMDRSLKKREKRDYTLREQDDFGEGIAYGHNSEYDKKFTTLEQAQDEQKGLFNIDILKNLKKKIKLNAKLLRALRKLPTKTNPYFGLCVKPPVY